MAGVRTAIRFSQISQRNWRRHLLNFPSIRRTQTCDKFSVRRMERVTQIVQMSSFHTNYPCRKTFEPDYLDSAGLVPSTYPTINIQVKGYDFDILESYQSYVHNLAENIGLDVSEAWATPGSSWNVYTYAEESTAIKDTYNLHMYERNIQLINVETTDLPVLIDILRKTLPEGVKLSVHEHKPEHYEAR